LTINIRVRAHFEITGEGRKTYRGSQHVKTIVDINSFTLMQLVDFICADFVWNSKQFISLHRGDNGNGEIRSYEQLKQWLDVNLQKGVAHIEAQINDFSGLLQCSPTKRMFHPKVRNPEQPACTKKVQKGKKRCFDEVLSDSSYDTDISSSSNSELDSVYAPDIDILDSEDGDDITDFSYDVDDPCIDVDVVFLDVDQCKSAVTYHAILHDYAYTTCEEK
jgi:hypothetical protein